MFLSGEREIRDADDALRAHLGDRLDPRHPRHTELLPLFSRLSGAEQHRVFESHPGRRVVLATNIAETSLTVPGVRYVVDPGTARISRWSKATKVQRLPIEPISQASARQRSGRCGRVADGVAIRLYSEADFDARPEFTEPEILRTSLASVILQMIAVGVAASPEDVATFPFVDQPDTRAVRDGVQLLVELGALARTTGAADGALHLTDIGRALALLPIDPRLARMIVEGGRRGVAREVMIIAAALSIQDPRERPAEVPRAGRRRCTAGSPTRRRTCSPTSTCGTTCASSQRELSGSAFRRMCRAEHLSYLRLREWQDVVTQLKQLAKPLGIRTAPAPRPDPPSAPHAGTDGAARGDGAATRRRVGRGGDPSARAGGAAVADRAAGGDRGARRAGAAARADRDRQGPAPTAQRVRRGARGAVRDLPRLRAGQEAPGLGDGRRARGDLPAVGPRRGPDRAGVGRGARRAPGQAHLLRADLVGQAGRGDGHRAGHAVRRARS